jgi:hypothetical protein
LLSLNIDKTAKGSVPDINAENRSKRNIEEIPRIHFVNNVRNIKLRDKKTNVNFNACDENISNSLNLNLDEESNTIITRANIPTEVRNNGGNCIKGEPL